MAHHRLRDPGIVAALAPLLLYFTVLWHYTLDVPYWDDYGGVLGGLIERHDGVPLVRHVLTPHTDHVIAVARVAILATHALLGTIDFAVLIVLGNLWLVGALAAVIALAGPETRRDPLFVLVAAMLLFSPALWDSGLWALTALSHFPAVAFAAASFWALTRAAGAPRWVPYASLGCAVGAALSQSNGLLVFPLAMAWLLARGRGRWLAAWLFAFAIVLAVFFWVRNTLGNPSPSDVGGVLRSPVEAGRFLLVFLGGHLAGGIGIAPRGWLGLALLALLGAGSIVAGRARPGLALVAAFAIGSGAMAAVGRLSLGVQGATSGRYGVYSSLLLVAVVALYWPWLARSRAVALLLAGLAAGTSLLTWQAARPAIEQRYERNALLHRRGVAPCFDTFNHPDQTRARALLEQAAERGIYAWKPSAPAAACAPPSLQVVVGERVRGRARSVQGEIEQVARAADQVRWTGWAPVSEHELSYFLFAPDEPVSSGLEIVQRLDVVKALGRPDLSSAGFQITLSFASEEAARRAEESACLGFVVRGPRGRRTHLLPNRDPACERFLVGGAGGQPGSGPGAAP